MQVLRGDIIATINSKWSRLNVYTKEDEKWVKEKRVLLNAKAKEGDQIIVTSDYRVYIGNKMFIGYLNGEKDWENFEKQRNNEIETLNDSHAGISGPLISPDRQWILYTSEF